MSHRRSRPSSPSPELANPLEDDDLLHEILLRLPPQPPYLLRASLVSKRWRRLATDRKFLRRFHLHHRRPPLLGLLSCQEGKISFRSTLDPPYRIPPDRFSPRPPNGREDWSLLDCRHGRLLFDDWKRRQVVVWDPITDDYRVVVEPPQFLESGFAVIYSGAVLCAAGELGHVHGDCHSSPFQVVLLATLRNAHVFTVATVYSSKTGMWSDLLSTPFSSFSIYRNNPPGILVGNTIHWMLLGGTTGIQFDLDSQRLTVIESPPGFHDSLQIIHSEDGGVAFATLSGPWNTPCFQIWEREVNSYGVARWELRKTVELQKILGLRLKIDTELSSIVGYAEDINAIFLWVHSFVYMVQIESMQSKELFQSDTLHIYHPFTSFYTQGTESSLRRK